MKRILSSPIVALYTIAVVLSSIPAALAMDQVRIESRIDDAIAKYGVTGKGVIVATLDRGIDWKNNDFRNADGTTRIKWIFDLSDNSGAHAAGNPYGRGTISSEAQINAALNGGPTLATRDAVGHGTDTAGIPAGNGRNVYKYRGVAPEATLIVCKVTSEGAPAHDVQPAEAPFNDPTAFPIAIDFVKAKAAELQMPCVMILNLGSSGGPTDGTSELARKIDSTVGPGIPGLVFVTGPGDDGGAPNRAGGVVTKGGTATISINKTQAGPLIFDLWYPAGGSRDNLDVTIQTPSGSFGPFAAPAAENSSDFQTGGGKFAYYHLGSAVHFYNAANAKREIYIRFDEGAGNYAVTLSGARLVSADRRFDATLNPSEFFQTPSPNAFTSFNAPGSIWDGATALNNICPGDYVHRTSWTDIDGIARSQMDQGAIGEIWKGSGTGPTFDGRLGVDVCAPGDSVFTVYNPTSYFATFRFNKIQDGLGFYGRQSAVSAAAPITTGVIALMLQKNPQLDAPTVKRILQQSARADSFTGSVPNPTWGYGKLDASAALDLVNAGLPTSTLLNIATRLRVQTGENVLIGGFIITGTGSKKVIIRGIGPSLAQFFNGALADPTLELFQGNTMLASNNDWKESQAEIEATGIPPTNDKESAIVRMLAPGNYTAVLRGNGGSTGIGVVEVYDLDQNSNSKLANIASRGFVDTDNNVMIGGLIVGPSGGASTKVVVRAIGPTLSNFGIAGALQDPTLDLVNSSGAVVRSNNNWKDSQQTEIEATGLQPSDIREAALVEVLAPGNYTAIVRGVGNTTGVGLVEVYNVQ
jgi:minor extracellular serine protease Vpr